MPLYDFEVFDTIARYRNLTKASADLHLSQPALTQKLKTLETKYNTKLYRKTRTGIELTDAGKLLFKYTTNVLRQHDKLKAKLSATTAVTEAPSLTVGGSYSPATSLLPSLMGRFQKSHPHIELDLRTGNRLAIERLILQNEVDLAIINNPPLNPHLTMEPYRSEPLVAFVAPRHPLAKKKQLDPEDLSRVGLIIRRHIGSRAAAYDYVKHLRKIGLKPNVIMHCDTPGAVKEAVRSKMGIGILYRGAVADSIDRHEFKAIKMPGEAPQGKSYIIYHKHKPLTPSAQAFLELLRREKSKSR